MLTAPLSRALSYLSIIEIYRDGQLPWQQAHVPSRTLPPTRPLHSPCPPLSLRAPARNTAMDRVSAELLGQVFCHLDTRTTLLILPRVCRRWKDVCSGMSVDRLDMGFAREQLSRIEAEPRRASASPQSPAFCFIIPPNPLQAVLSCMQQIVASPSPLAPLAPLLTRGLTGSSPLWAAGVLVSGAAGRVCDQHGAVGAGTPGVGGPQLIRRACCPAWVGVGVGVAQAVVAALSRVAGAERVILRGSFAGVLNHMTYLTDDALQAACKLRRLTHLDLQQVTRPPNEAHARVCARVGACVRVCMCARVPSSLRMGLGVAPPTPRPSTAHTWALTRSLARAAAPPHLRRGPRAGTAPRFRTLPSRTSARSINCSAWTCAAATRSRTPAWRRWAASST